MLVEEDSRNCFAVAWYGGLQESQWAGDVVAKRGNRAVEGFLDGMVMGRDKGLGRQEDGRRLYAVRHQSGAPDPTKRK